MSTKKNNEEGVNSTEVNSIWNLIGKAFSSYKDKIWFQVLFVLVVIYMLGYPMINSIVTRSVQKAATSDAVNETLDLRESQQNVMHQDDFEKSKQSYAIVKKIMTDYLTEIDCEYIFLIEYHNGNENVMTGIQFCKFDVTLEVASPECPYVPTDKFRNDIIARYDILLSDELNSGKLLFYTKEGFEKVDRYLALQLQYLGAESFSIINLTDVRGRVFGSLICASINENMNVTEVLSLSREIEGIINKVEK